MQLRPLNAAHNCAYYTSENLTQFTEPLASTASLKGRAQRATFLGTAPNEVYFFLNSTFFQ